MYLNDIIFYIILIIIFIIIIKIVKLEKFNNIPDLSKTNDKQNLSDIDNITSYNPNIKRKPTASFIEITKQFPEVSIFENDPDFRLGLDKCYEYKKNNNNKGNCVEYGLTGNAWYFPKVDIDYRNIKYKAIKSNQQNDFEIINVDERNLNEPNQSKLSYVFR